MKRLYTGGILVDSVDVICISFSIGSTIAYIFKTYKTYKNKNRKEIVMDPLVHELKEISPIVLISDRGKPLKLPTIRGGDIVLNNLGKPRLLWSVVIKNQKIADLIRAIVLIKSHQRKLQILQYVFFLANNLLTYSVNLRVAVGGSLDYTQILLIAFPSALGGLLVGLRTAYPLAGALLPLAFLYNRGIEDIPDPASKCKALCKFAEEFHNNQLKLEMKNIIQETSPAFQLPLDKAPLACVEEKLSLVQRYKLREVIESSRARKQIQHFSEFIKKFPECDPDPKKVYDEIINKISE
jgi:hypothetical protein